MKLVLIRHGESVWNKENKFTGWTDVELSEKGIEEAHAIGKKLAEQHVDFGIAYTSVLKRAEDTLQIVLEELGVNIKVRKSYKLNERHYGALQGLNKDGARVQYGEEQVAKWRRSYDIKPPELALSDERFPGKDPKYKDVLIYELPLSESLKDTYERVVDYFEDEISTFLRVGENVLVVAHGNTLRALIKYLENISDEEITKLEIPTGSATVYDFDDALAIVNKTDIDL